MEWHDTKLQRRKNFNSAPSAVSFLRMLRVGVMLVDFLEQRKTVNGDHTMKGAWW